MASWWWRLQSRMPGWWWGLQGRLAAWRLQKMLREAAAGNPVRMRLLDLCNEVEARGIDALTARQQVVVWAWNVYGIVGNGGFRYLLEGEIPLAPAAEAFRTLGFDGAAAACERVMAAIAAAPAVGDRGRREATRDSVAFDAEDSAMFEVSWETLERAISDYMRRNPRDFPGMR